jgi:outer membrane cobalamin receptor
MIKHFKWVFILLGIVASISFAQPPRGDFKGSINGFVYDVKNSIPLEYANIVLYRQRDSLQVTGTITNKDGYFALNDILPGRYYLDIYFMGYEKKRMSDLRVNPQDLEIKLGVIDLKPVVLREKIIEVEAERPAISYQIDKKVINVSEQFTAISGTAVDVLENVPSVSVDIEGNVSLRGSSNFIVLIDGRPSILEPSDALQQIPASSIESIEIITNPSAKYDPDGTSGIINIIMKKVKVQGGSGIVNLNGGLNNKYGSDFLYQYRYGAWNFTLGGDYNRRNFPGSARSENQTTRSNLTSYVYSIGDSKRGGRFYSLRGNVEFNFSNKDYISLGLRYGARSFENQSDMDYNTWTDTTDTHSFYTSIIERERSGDFFSINLDYKHTFKEKDHQLSAQLIMDHRGGDEKATDKLLDTENRITSGRIATEKGPGNSLRAKVDYTLPLKNNHKFETGYQSRLSISEDNTDFAEYDAAQSRYLYLPEYVHNTDYQDNIHSLYTIISGEWKHFGYQTGLRGEYTYRLIEYSGKMEKFKIDRWDYFPTLHSSYKFSEGQQVMASYTRRIDRPRGYYLEPYLTWMDAYNVRIGNPALKPEYIDSYEMGYQTTISNSVFSTELYYRVNHNKVERVRSVYDQNITLHSIENVGTDYSFGSELLLNMNLIKIWNVNLTANLYDYWIEGILYGESFSRESFNWSTQLSNNIKLIGYFNLQINARYNSPTVSSQGRREGFFISDIAIKKEFLNRSLSLTLQIRDILKTGKYEFTSQGKDFYTYNHFTRESPVVMLNIRYNINQYKKKNDRERNNNNEGYESEGEEEF